MRRRATAAALAWAKAAGRRGGQQGAPFSSPGRTQAGSATDPALISLTINGRPVAGTPAGLTLLEAARSAGVAIPTLCAHPRLPGIGGACRVCLVEDEQTGRLVPACRTPAAPGASIVTDTPAVRAAVRSALALLRASGDHTSCPTCEAAGHCELADLLARYNVGPDGGGGLLPKSAFHEWEEASEGEEEEVEAGKHAAAPRHLASGAITIDLDRCVHCGRCVVACGALTGAAVLGMVGRGGRSGPGVVVGVGAEGGSGLAAAGCVGCGQCAAACPTGAIEATPAWRGVADLLDSGRVPVAIQVAPAVLAAMGEELGSGTTPLPPGQLVAALRAAGFAAVYDTSLAADVVAVEEAAELMRRLEVAGRGGDGPAAHALPLLSSCCPAWVALVERAAPALVPNLSTTRSPHIALGGILKTPRLAGRAPSEEEGGGAPPPPFLVSAMPCTAKKIEAGDDRLVLEGGARAVDAVLTTRELGRLVRARGVEAAASLAPTPFDSPLGQASASAGGDEASGAGALFAASGGVTEAVLQSVYAWVAGAPPPPGALTATRGLAGVKEVSLALPPAAAAAAGVPPLLRAVIVSGVGHARELLEKLTAAAAAAPGGNIDPPFHLVEVMACPGGCVGGGGQPRSADPAILLKRTVATHATGDGAAVQAAHDNPAVQTLYGRVGGGVGGAGAEAAFHRTYSY